MPNSILYLSQLLLPPSSLSLGDLITNRIHPSQGGTYRPPPNQSNQWTLTTDIKVKYHLLSDIFRHIIPIGIDAHANNLFGLVISSGASDARDTLDNLQAKCLKLLEPVEKFEESYLRDPSVTTWLARQEQSGDEVFMVTGLYSISNAQVESLVKRIGGKVGMPIAEKGRGDEQRQVNGNGNRNGNAMVHPDEMIFGIKYRKVSLKG